MLVHRTTKNTYIVLVNFDSNSLLEQEHTYLVIGLNLSTGAIHRGKLYCLFRTLLSRLKKSISRFVVS